MYETTKRNGEIYAARQTGESCASIGKRYGISGSRVKQICVNIERGFRNSDGKKMERAFISFGGSYGKQILIILRTNGIYKLELLKEIPDAELMKIKGIGNNAIQVIHRVIEQKELFTDRDNSRRNQDIYEAHKNGESLRSIGERYYMTGENVRKICLRTERKLMRSTKGIDPLMDACMEKAESERLAVMTYNRIRWGGYDTIEKLKEANPSHEEVMRFRHTGVKIAEIIMKIIKEC